MFYEDSVEPFFKALANDRIKNNIESLNLSGLSFGVLFSKENDKEPRSREVQAVDLKSLNELFKVVEKTISSFSSLRYLRFVGMTVNSGCAYIERLSLLEDLNLSRNSMSNSSLKVLSNALKHCPRLKVLNLAKNDFTGAAVRDLLLTITHSCPSLQELNLSQNMIKYDGTLSLLQVVSENKKSSLRNLVSLHLASCGLDNEDIKYLKMAVRKMPQLIFLDISKNNHISNDWLPASILDECPQMEMMTVPSSYSGYPLSEEAVSYIKGASALVSYTCQEAHMSEEVQKHLDTNLRRSYISNLLLGTLRSNRNTPLHDSFFYNAICERLLLKEFVRFLI